jgi:hypothetical protein
MAMSTTTSAWEIVVLAEEKDGRRYIQITVPPQSARRRCIHHRIIIWNRMGVANATIAATRLVLSIVVIETTISTPSPPKSHP